MKIIVLLFVLLLAQSNILASTKIVFKDAAALWIMADLHDHGGGGCTLTPEGKIRIGIKLQGDELLQSKKRGGDGFVARVDGGYFLAGSKIGENFNLSGKAMTLLMRIKVDNETWRSPLFGRYDEDNTYSQVLYGENQKLNYLWQTGPVQERVRMEDGQVIGKHQQRFFDGILELGVKTENFANGRWHDIVIRFADANLELYVDGVLVDEEWPHGELYRFQAPFLIAAQLQDGRVQSGFKGFIDHVALWDRALSHEEIIQISGGQQAVSIRDKEILGPKDIQIQYWKPRGQGFAGDCLPYYHDGVFHMFYLFDRRHHGSKWNKGAHQFAHLSSTDLVNWTEHPLAVPILKQWENSMGTCCVIYNHKDSTFYAFYTDCGIRTEFIDKPHHGSAVFVSTSRDGINFTKDFKRLLEGHDVEVFFDEDSDKFYLIRHGTQLLKSSDMKTWKDEGKELVKKPKGTSDECPDHFQFGDWYYFILGRNALWKSGMPLGPWEAISEIIYDGLMVPKVADFKDGRKIVCGFVDYPGWGGNIVMRELVQYPGGHLGMKWPDEVIPKSGPPLDLIFSPQTKGATGNAGLITIQGESDLEMGMLSNVEQDVYIRMDVVPEQGTEVFGLCVRGGDDYNSGRELRFEPEKERVQFGNPENGSLARESNDPAWKGYNFHISDVKGLAEPFQLEIIIKDRIVDVCIDRRRTIINRLRDIDNHKSDKLVFFVKDGRVNFKDIQVRPLLHKEHPYIY